MPIPLANSIAADQLQQKHREALLNGAGADDLDLVDECFTETGDFAFHVPRKLWVLLCQTGYFFCIDEDQSNALAEGDGIGRIAHAGPECIKSHRVARAEQA